MSNLVGDAVGGVELPYLLKYFGRSAHLFLQFLAGGALQGHTEFEPSGGKLPAPIVNRLAIVIDENDLPCIGDRNDPDGARVIDDIEGVRHAIWQYDFILANTEPGRRPDCPAAT